MSTTTKRLSERFAAPLSGGTVDRAAGVIKNVLVCGTTSANGRSYPWGKGLTCDPAKYEGRPVNADHGDKASVGRRIGWLQDVRVGSDGRPRADLHILTSHANGPAVLEAAERNPALFGLSHVAVCRTRMDRGTEIIESVESVESVDLVADPATTKSLYESTTAMPTTLRKFLEGVGGSRRPAAAKWSRAKWVREMDDMPPMDMPAPPMDDMAEPEADSSIDDAFLSVYLSMAQELAGAVGDKPAQKIIVGRMLKAAYAHGDINGDGKVDEADVDAAMAGDDDMMDDGETMESKGGRYALRIMADLERSGLQVNRENIELVGAMTPARRPALIKRLAEGGRATAPKSSGRTANLAAAAGKSGEAMPEVTFS